MQFKLYLTKGGFNLSKVMKLKDAIAKYVEDGDVIVFKFNV